MRKTRADSRDTKEIHRRRQSLKSACEEEDVSFFINRGRCYTVKTLHCVSCSLNMIKAVFSHKKDEIIVKYEKKNHILKSRNKEIGKEVRLGH